MAVSRYVRPTPLAWLFFIGAFATTVGLGTWQVQRLQWKEGLVAEIAAAKQNAPLTLKDLPKNEAEWKAKNFWPVKLTGTWDHSIEYHIGTRYYKSQRGYHVVQPLVLPDKRVVFVNRGWIPMEKKAIETRPRSIGVGRATVNGIIRYGSERNRLTPPNAPEKNFWFDRDINEMADYYHVKNVLPAMVDAAGPQDADTLPIPSDGDIKIYNQHLSYIITWYGIALGVLVIFILSHRKKA